MQEFLWPVLRSHQRMERARCSPVLRVSWRGDGRACVALFWGGSFGAGARSPGCRWAQTAPGWSCTDREMPRSPLCRTEACKASVTHPGPWEEFSKARHGLISAQSFTQGCPRPVASLPRSALSPCHPPCMFTVYLLGFALKFLAPGSRQRVGMSHAGQGSASWEGGGGSSRPCHQRP